MSHIYQATNIKQINDVGKRFNRDVIDLTVIKQMFPNANLDDPNILALLEGLLASSAETKMSVVDKKNDPFEKKDVDFESQDTNDIDDVLGGETWEEMVEKLQNETFIPPGAIVNLHKITDVRSGHSVSLGSRSYTDVFQVERFTDVQYEQWVKNKLILL
jgi:hypothetical protein